MTYDGSIALYSSHYILFQALLHSECIYCSLEKSHASMLHQPRTQRYLALSFLF